MFFSWKYQSSSDLGGTTYSGFVAKYSGAGFVQVKMIFPFVSLLQIAANANIVPFNNITYLLTLNNVVKTILIYIFYISSYQVNKNFCIYYYILSGISFSEERNGRNHSRVEGIDLDRPSHEVHQHRLHRLQRQPQSLLHR